MRKTNTLYWIFTILFALFMLTATIPDLLVTAQAVEFMTKLGYPAYITPFLGVAKLLGIIAILIPGYPRIKEWAYAGLMFDVLGATYSIIAIDHAPLHWLPMLIPIILCILSYRFYRKRLNHAPVYEKQPSLA